MLLANNLTNADTRAKGNEAATSKYFEENVENQLEPQRDNLTGTWPPGQRKRKAVLRPPLPEPEAGNVASQTVVVKQSVTSITTSTTTVLKGYYIDDQWYPMS